jgi:hypothetical protein
MYKNLLLAVCLCAWIAALYLMGSSEAHGQQAAGQYGAQAAQRPQGGSATAGVFPAVLDSEKRPITAGGFVKEGPIVFQEIAEKAGLTSWHHNMGTPEKNYIIETTGSGVALLDYDNDGWPDIYVSNFGKNRLYHNNHDGTFTDVAEKAGVTLGNWSTGATFGDYDGDGKLDLFVPGYIHWDMEHLPPKPNSAANAVNFCQFRGIGVMCGPRGLPGEGDHLFHKNGDGTFTDVSEKAGVGARNLLITTTMGGKTFLPSMGLSIRRWINTISVHLSRRGHSCFTTEKRAAKARCPPARARTRWCPRRTAEQS